MCLRSTQHHRRHISACDRHEYISGYYRVSVYFLSKMLCDIVLRTITSVIFSCVIYFMIGKKNTPVKTNRVAWYFGLWIQSSVTPTVSSQHQRLIFLYLSRRCQWKLICCHVSDTHGCTWPLKLKKRKKNENNFQSPLSFLWVSYFRICHHSNTSIAIPA